jgi:hypothetical protein
VSIIKLCYFISKIPSNSEFLHLQVITLLSFSLWFASWIVLDGHQWVICQSRYITQSKDFYHMLFVEVQFLCCVYKVRNHCGCTLTVTRRSVSPTRHPDPLEIREPTFGHPAKQSSTKQFSISRTWILSPPYFSFYSLGLSRSLSFRLRLNIQIIMYIYIRVTLSLLFQLSLGLV